MNKMNNRMLKRILKTFLVFAMIFSFSLNSFAISAQAADQKSRITKQVNAYMSAITRYDIKKVKKLMIDKDCLHCTDKKLQKHIRRINRECLKYEITSVKVRGKSATVNLHVSQYNIQTDFQYAIREIIWEYRKSWTSDKVIKKLNKYLRANYHPDADSEHFDYNISLRLEKRGNQWMISKMNNDILFIKDAGLTYFSQDFYKHPKKYL